MKDLKENIQKYNMKKLVLSAVFGVFCYCTNNAMEDPQPVKVKDINYVLNFMIQGQMMILTAKLKMLPQSKKIYSTIKDQEGKVTKKNLLNFIQNQIPQPEQNEEKFKDDIKEIEQYFHLEEIKDDEECNEGNLTEIFWDKGKEGDMGEGGEEGEGKIKDVVDEIKSYFIRIILIEKTISKIFKDYYDAKKTEKGEVEKVEDVIIEEIMNECCGKETDGDMPTKFFANLGNLCPKKLLEDFKKTILATIKKRITLKNPITEDNLKSFLRQKIGIEEKKEDAKKEVGEKIGEGGCPCCDCWGKKKNQIEDENPPVKNESSKEKPVKIYKN